MAMPCLPVLFSAPLVPDEAIDLASSEINVYLSIKIVIRVAEAKEPAKESVQDF